MLFYLWILVHAISAAIVTLLVLQPLKSLLKDAGAVKLNFRDREVVNLMGVAIILVWLFLMSLVVVLTKGLDAIGWLAPPGFILSTEIGFPLTLIILGAGFFGLIDDLLGNRDSSGFKGHIGALLKGKLTTGALKALGIPIIAFFAMALLSGSLLETLGNAFLIALFVNTLNLLDLRPGRALKVYIPLQLLFIFMAVSSLGTVAAALAGIAFVLIGPDLKEEIMLGDTGSNVLGGALGFCFAAAFGWDVKIAAIIVLIALQLFAEKFSISVLIEKTPILRALDAVGRRAE
jgi:hypothetical protein